MDLATIFAFLDRFGWVEGSLVLLIWHIVRERRKHQSERSTESEQTRLETIRELAAVRSALDRLHQLVPKEKPAKDQRLWRRLIPKHPFSRKTSEGTAALTTLRGGQTMTRRYLGNSNKMEVHDRHNEQPQCNLDLIKAEHQVYFSTLKEAHDAGYDNCAYCIGNSKR